MNGKPRSEMKRRITSGPTLSGKRSPPFMDLRDVIDSAKQKFETGLDQSPEEKAKDKMKKSSSAPASPNKSSLCVVTALSHPQKRPRLLRGSVSPMDRRSSLLMAASGPKTSDSAEPLDSKKAVKKANSVSMNEVIKLHQDEGVMHLLHGLPSSRRRASASQMVSVTQSVFRRRPSSEVDRRPLKGLSQSSSDSSSKKPSVREVLTLRHTNPDNVLSSVVDPKRIKPCSQDELMTQSSLEMLKQLPTKDYVRLWSSPSRYSLISQRHDDLFKSEDASNSQASPSGSVTSMESSVSSAAQKSIALQAKVAAEKPARLSQWKIHTKNYKDILIRTYSSFAQIILSPTTTGLKHSINVNTCEELIDALKQLDEDAECRSVLFTGIGGVFCQGVDLTVLANESIEKQKRAAEALANSVKRLVRQLISSSKILVAAVNGKATGLGVTLLPYFDLVYASDKAEFSMEYARLGQIPEAFASQTKIADCHEMLLMGHAFTASMAQSAGLVSAIVWPGKFLEEIVPRMESLEFMNISGLRIVKQSLKKALISRVTAIAEDETKDLICQWSMADFAKSARNYLKSSHLIFQ